MSIDRDRKKRARAMMRVLKTIFPQDDGTALHYTNTWELLVATILSAQCTDKRVNEVTKKLFKKYKNLDAYVAADQKEFEQDIRSTGFYKNKTKNILSAAKKIKNDYKGAVPKKMDELLTLPGVARKTANVVLGNAFGVFEGIAVDTHVRRFAIKFNLTMHRDPHRIEQDLMQILPKKNWFDFGNKLIAYGRTICNARKHACEEHPLTKIYPIASKIWPKSK